MQAPPGPGGPSTGAPAPPDVDQLNVEHLNPYQPALAGGPDSSLPKVFSSNSVAAASFFGSALAGTILLYLSLSRLGMPREARNALVMGGALTVVSLGLAVVLPQGMGNALPLAATFGMLALARKQLDAPVAAHLARGGGFASAWHTAGVCVVSALVSVGLIVGATLSFDGLGQEFVETSPGHRVIYEGKATRADAEAVGALLEREHVFAPDQPGEVILGGSKQKITMKVVLASGWRDKATVEFYTELAKQVGTASGRRFVDILLCDDFLKVKQKVSVSNAS